MSGKRELKPTKRERPEKGAMARKLVVFCVAILAVTAVWAAVVKTIAPTSDLSDVLTFVGAAFGGELLLLLLKRVFAKPNETEESAEL